MFVCALLIVSIGSMVTFQVTGAVDTMSSDAAQSLNTTCTSYTVLPVILIVIVAIAVVCMVNLAGRAF